LTFGTVTWKVSLRYNDLNKSISTVRRSESTPTHLIKKIAGLENRVCYSSSKDQSHPRRAGRDWRVRMAECWQDGPPAKEAKAASSAAVAAERQRGRETSAPFAMVSTARYSSSVSSPPSPTSARTTSMCRRQQSSRGGRLHGKAREQPNQPRNGSLPSGCACDCQSVTSPAQER